MHTLKWRKEGEEEESLKMIAWSEGNEGEGEAEENTKIDRRGYFFLCWKDKTITAREPCAHLRIY